MAPRMNGTSTWVRGVGGRGSRGGLGRGDLMMGGGALDKSNIIGIIGMDEFLHEGLPLLELFLILAL